MPDIEVQFTPSGTPLLEHVVFESNQGFITGEVGPSHVLADAFGSDNNIGRWHFLRSLKAPTAWLYKMTIKKDSRGQGFGTKLLEQALKILGESGVRYVLLSPRPENFDDTERLDRFYKRFGFVEVKDFKGKHLWSRLMFLDLAHKS
jgi:GNAT superfamily N-acetyltransferase